MESSASRHCLSASRRDFLLKTAAAGAAFSVSLPAAAAAIGNMSGEVYVNGKRAGRDTVIRPGDKIRTGPDSSVVFAVGKDAFMLRQLTSLMMETGKDAAFITGLRIVTGALVAVFGSGMKMLHTSAVTAAIRGTGVYIETNPVLTYFCTCYGEVDLTSTAYGSRKSVKARNHASNYVYAKVMSGDAIVQAPLINHTNEELALLERLVGRESPLPKSGG